MKLLLTTVSAKIYCLKGLTLIRVAKQAKKNFPELHCGKVVSKHIAQNETKQDKLNGMQKRFFPYLCVRREYVISFKINL